MKLNSGKLVIAAILIAAFSAAGVAWWYQFQQGRLALAYWGADGAGLIRSAPHVELMRLSPTQENGDLGDNAATVAGQAILQRQEIAAARGLVHARQALITDASFDWGSPPDEEPTWQYALRFSDGKREATVLFDLENHWVRSFARSRSVGLGPTLSRGLEVFFAEQATEPQAVAPSR